MFRSIDLSNVRLFEGAGWHFDLRPLTIFCGTNSSGKSTVLKSLLLLQQSLTQQDVVPKGKNQIKFVGEQVDLGDYRAFVSHNDQTLDAAIAVSLDQHLDPFALSLLEDQDDRLGSGERAKDANATFDASMTFGVSGRVVPPDQSTMSAPVLPAILKEGLYSVAWADKRLSWSVKLDRSKHTFTATFPPELLERDFTLTSLLEASLVKRNSKHGTTVKCEMSGLLPSYLKVPQQGKKQGGRTSSQSASVHYPFPYLCSSFMQSLASNLSSLIHLGPLRAPAQRYYVTTLDTSPTVDASGEYIAYTLREMGELKVACRLPKSSRLEHAPLGVALRSWLHYLRTGSSESEDALVREISINTTRNVLIECMLASNNGTELHSLVDSGFGYSQVLPMVIKLLMAPVGSTIIIEQPELHLNPALQVRVAEFLVSVVLSGKQVLVETHSEHIVNAMRVFAAEDKGSKLSDDTIIYFMDSSDVLPQVIPMKIERNGSVPDWPAVFFGEAIELSSRLLRAQLPESKSKLR